jgi:hypothetical protein
MEENDHLRSPKRTFSTPSLISLDVYSEMRYTNRSPAADDAKIAESPTDWVREEVRIPTGRTTGPGIGYGGPARDIELHAPVGQIDGDGGEGRASGVF